jgi:uncharacterized protein (DUF1919 family)
MIFNVFFYKYLNIVDFYLECRNLYQQGFIKERTVYSEKVYKQTRTG